MNSIYLSTGRLIHCDRLPDGTVFAECDDGGEMSADEWDEYADLVAARARRQASTRKPAMAAFAQRIGGASC